MNRYQDLFDTLSSADTVLTPNQRLAAYLRKRYNENQKTAVFNSADILPIQAWLQRLYETALAQQWTDKIVLTTEQELILWEKIIHQHPMATALLSKPHKTAQLAQKAWELVQQWQLPLKALEHSHHSETEQFLAWLRPFKKTLAAQDWLTLAELPAHLVQHLPIPYCQTLPAVHLVGFDEIPPVMRDFLNTLEERGVKVHSELNLDPRPAAEDDNRSKLATATAYKLHCKNTLEELNLALHFAQHELKKNGAARIGIVVPELVQQRNAIVSLCQKLFYADAHFQPPENNPFVNISGGIPLSNSLLVQSIFAALKIQSHPIAIPDLYWLWHSPYFNFGAYNAERSRLEQNLCKQYNKYISHNTLLRFIHKQLSLKESHLPDFYSALKAPPSHNPSAKSHHTWVQIIHRYLIALGFPGQRSLVSSDVQRLNAFEEVLGTFASLDTVEERVSFDEALVQLQYLCQQKLFQAKTRDAPIQVLGLLEASGLEYTHLWITGLNEGIFPSNPHPTPLLPISLQKKWAMPHADSQREFHFAQKLLTRLFTQSDTIICSYSEKNHDISLRPSPLISTLPLFNRELLPIHVEEKRPVALKTEYIDDAQGLSLAAHAPVRGGSTLFKLQAQCPFKAYASLRLNAEENDYPGLGLSPALRGSVVHTALQHFYHTIRSQSQLLTLSKEEQQQLLQKVCHQALTHLHEQQPPAEYRRHYGLELARLEKLLSLWLEQEKMRPHFTIIATEKRLEVDFAGLELTVQIDRIDRLDDGAEIIIDYKTGPAHIGDWLGERPNEPQMPLYCSVYDSDIQAMAFAKVHLHKIGMEGIGAISDDWPAIKRLTLSTVEGNNPWQQQKTLWRQQLTLLANEFKQGYAAITPKEGACDYCHLPALCRIHLQQNAGNTE